MGHRYVETLFTPAVKAIQQQQGSRNSYASMEQGADYNDCIGPREAEFIAARNSFYMATVSEDGWPYLQHRGGPDGFLRVLDKHTLGFADFSGNRQYISAGNLSCNDRVALFLMDYPNQRRLKIIGRVEIIGLDQPERLAQLEMDDYRANVERGFIITLEGFDWNCPQHITPRYSPQELEPLLAENRRLKEQLAQSATSAPTALGDGPLALTITAIEQLTPRIRAYTLKRPNGDLLPAVKAGASLQVPVQLASGELVLRHYSICSDPGQTDYYQIAVQHEPDGRGGSTAVHRGYQLGMQLNCLQPGNNFALEESNRPAVLIAGGIGITPLRAMALALKAHGAPIQLHYAGRSALQMAFADQLKTQLGDQLSLYRRDQGERLDIETILASSSPDSHIYVCGPDRLIDAVHKTARLLGWPDEQVHSERFQHGPDANDKPIQLTLARSRKTLEVAADQTVLEAVLEAGVELPSSCNAGQCRTCRVKVLEGSPDHRDSALSTDERNRQQLMTPCVSRALSKTLVLDI